VFLFVAHYYRKERARLRRREKIVCNLLIGKEKVQTPVHPALSLKPSGSPDFERNVQPG
jgi:hypothetical protein